MSESKEAMQNTIKNLQAKSEHISKLEDKGSKVVVLQLGSHTVKMGFANEKAPFSISPFVAYRKKGESAKETNPPQTEDKFDYEWFKNEYHRIEDMLKVEGVINAESKPFKGKPRAKQIVTVDHIPPFNPINQVLFGEQALRVENNPAYIFRKIIKYGTLNVSSNADAELKICLSDFQNLIIYLMRQKMKIPEPEWASFNCILIIPDLFIRKQVKGLIQLIFSRIGFKKVYIHLESVMACFGTAVSSACVVDIGHQKISVCCVDQGIILPKTLIKKNFGGKSLSKILGKIFNDRITEPSVGSLKLASESDMHQVDKIKQIASAMREPEQTSNRIYEIILFRKEVEVALQIPYTDSICIASNAFFSDIWNAFQAPAIRDPFDYRSSMYDLYEDPEDYFEEYSGGGHIFDTNLESSGFATEKLLDPFIYHSIEDIILTSLLSIKDVDVRRKFTSSILIIGGSGHIHKFTEEILIKLNSKMEGIVGMEERAELATDLPLREIAPIHASWLGGTVIPKLDSLRDLWIERNKFLGGICSENDQEEENAFDKKLFTRKEQSQEWGIRYLKEKVPFVW